jgi:hypothetical protein
MATARPGSLATAPDAGADAVGDASAVTWVPVGMSEDSSTSELLKVIEVPKLGELADLVDDDVVSLSDVVSVVRLSVSVSSVEDVRVAAGGTCSQVSNPCTVCTSRLAPGQLSRTLLMTDKWALFQAYQSGRNEVNLSPTSPVMLKSHSSDIDSVV